MQFFPPLEDAAYLISSYTTYFFSGKAAYFSSGNTVWPWQFIHEMLCITKLIGELSLYTGFFNNAKSYLLHGLEIADKFQLASW